MKPPGYTHDAKRLNSLKDYNILDTLAEAGFEDIVNLAVQICETPVALVSFVSHDRQWFKARVGFEPCETDLSRSVCAHALVEPDLLVIADLTKDPRTRDNPLVTGEPHIRFYGGAPLRAADGEVVGSLCVIDGKPRPQGLTPQQSESLRGLARQVMAQLELRRAVAQRDASLEDNRRSQLRRNALFLVGDRLRAVKTIAESTRAASQIVARTLGLVRAGFGRIDATGDFVDIEPDWAASGFASVAGRHRLAEYRGLRASLKSGDGLIVADVGADPQIAPARERLLGLGVRALATLPVRDHSGGVSLIFAHSDAPRVWASEDIVFLRNVGDRVAASVARCEAEALQSTLNQELNHRMKNMLAMVQAIARQTLGSSDEKVRLEAFSSRLQALATANDILLQRNWVAAHIGEIVASVLHSLQSGDRFTLQGPDVVIGSRATLSLALLLHELCTNAIKYGALSRPAGQVHVAWKAGDGVFTLTWKEVNGPAAVEPTRKGFGSKLINMGLVGRGDVKLRYLPTGLEAEFEALLPQLQDGER